MNAGLGRWMGFADCRVVPLSVCHFENFAVTGSVKTVAAYARCYARVIALASVQCAAVFLSPCAPLISDCLQRCEAAMHALCAPISHVLAL